MMKKVLGILAVFAAILTFAGISLTSITGCGGGSSPTPTPTPSQIFPNDQSLAQTPPVKLGTSGANANDLGAKVCCLGTLGSLWTKTSVTNPVILIRHEPLLPKPDCGLKTGDVAPVLVCKRRRYAAP